MGDKIILIIIKSTPYTTLNSYESLRTAVGLWDHNVKLLWSGDAIYCLLKEADQTQTSHFIRDLPDLDIEAYVHLDSLIQRGLGPKNLIENVETLNNQDVTKILKEADVSFVF